MKGRKLISALLLLAVAGASVGAITLSACKNNRDTTTYYVSPDGTPDGDGSEKKPYDIRTLLDFDHTNDETGVDYGDPILKAGDTVLVKPGEYNLSERIQIGYSGEYNKPITIKNADPTQKATIKFYDMKFDDNARGVQINGNYFVWDSIDICGAGDNGMYIGGSYNIVQNCEFYDNRDTGLQLGRAYGSQGNVNLWPSYNLIKNCTSYNNYDNETYGENADGFAAKLTVGYGNIFDGCIAYRNSDDGWDLFAKTDSGNIGAVIIYNCVAFENGYLMETQADFNKKFPTFDKKKEETNTNSYKTRDGDGNGFKLGGSVMEGEVFVYNGLTFNNRMHGVTDNSNPGVLVIDGITSYNNAAGVDNNPNSETFGQIQYNADADDCANVNLARQTYSYNHISNTLSVIDGNSYCNTDDYRGTVTNSLLAIKNGASGYLFEDINEYDTNEKSAIIRKGKVVSTSAASEIFEEVPTLDFGIKDGGYFNIHKNFRNADGSVNMGNLLNQKNADSTYGSKLNKGSWEEYTHWEYSDLTTSASADDAIAQAIYDTLYLPCKQSSVYQNFQVVASMMDYKISWASSDSSVLKIADETVISFSKSEVYKVTVNRPDDADKTVTLTATIKVNGVTKNKTFEVTVKKNTYQVGTMSVSGLVENEIIIDQFDDYSLVDPVVENATSDSGVTIDPSKYDLSYTYKYATVGSTDFVTARKFDTDKAGIYRVTAKVTLKEGVNLREEDEKTGSYTYSVYVASKAAGISFAEGTNGFYVNKNGYTIYGEPTNPSGAIYVLRTAADVTAPAAAEVKAQGIKVEFKSTKLSLDFEDDNEEAYNVYYVFESADGNTLTEVQSYEVKTQDIATKAEFESMLAETESTIIYRLMQDIDCGGSVTTSANKFVGLFNGMGHTISNITLTNNDSSSVSKGAGALFQVVENGTIMNVTFDNITINDKGKATGIVGLMYGGYIYNVKIHNMKVNGTERVAALVGHISAESNSVTKTYIDRIEIVSPARYEQVTLNEDTFGAYKYYTLEGEEYVRAMTYDASATYYQRVADIYNSSKYTGALVGLIQAGDGGSGWCIVKISNVYSSIAIDGDDYAGGIVGRSDDRNVKDDLSIENVYFYGEVKARVRAAGILGGFSGKGKTAVSGSISLGTVYYGNNRDIVLTAQKNSSCIIGNFASSADMTVSNCFAPFTEYNSDYDCNTITATLLSRNKYARYWEDSMGFAIGSVWEYVTSDGGTTLEAPYIRLK